MNEDYLSLIKTRITSRSIYFNMSDIKTNLIDDLDIILAKLDFFELDTDAFNKEYIDLYLFILLIAFSNDFRTFKYKFYIISSTLEKINEINNPSLCIDRAASLKYKKGYYGSYKFITKNSSNYAGMSFKDIIYEEIERTKLIEKYNESI